MSPSKLTNSFYTVQVKKEKTIFKVYEISPALFTVHSASTDKNSSSAKQV